MGSHFLPSFYDHEFREWLYHAKILAHKLVKLPHIILSLLAAEINGKLNSGGSPNRSNKGLLRK